MLLKSATFWALKCSSSFTASLVKVLGREGKEERGGRERRRKGEEEGERKGKKGREKKGEEEEGRGKDVS